MAPVITIGMPFRNNAGTIASSIQSLLGQTLIDWELILIDDASTDRSAEAASAFGDPRIQLIRRQKNEGLSTGLNEAIRMGRGEYFARMDADDIAFPDRLAKQLRFLTAHPDIDLCGTEAVVFRDDGSAAGALRCRSRHEEICRRPWIGMNSLLHPTWLGKMRWFRENPYRAIFHKAQDRDLLFRAYRKSRFACLREILHGYRQETLALRKILVTRAYLTAALARNAVETGNPALLVGVVSQPFKAIADAVAITTGLNYKLLRHRAAPVSEDELEIWRGVWEAVNVPAAFPAEPKGSA